MTPARAAPEPRVLREYALLADGERGAVLGPAGDMAWLCAPRWDSGSVFSSLIGGIGAYTVTPVGRYVWGGAYEDASMIWRSRWVTTGGVVECREALAYPGDPHRVVLLRRVHAVDTPAAIEVVLQPRADYDREPLTDLHHQRGVWTGRVGPLWLRWTSGADARANDGALSARVELRAGQSHDLVLELSDTPLPAEPVDPEDAWRATETAWAATTASLDHLVAPAAARRSYAVLRGLTSRTQGMVAAATTSLPERAGAGRNYDYRYVWIRDQCYAGQAGAATGLDDLLDDAVSFVAQRLLDHGDQLAPAYTVAGGNLPDERHLDLPGYPGGTDIIGNRAHQQYQLDAFGEALLLFAAAARHDRLDNDHWKAAQTAADAITRRWTEPDAGIWEIDNRAWTHSRLTAAAGLRAAAAHDTGRHDFRRCAARYPPTIPAPSPPCTPICGS